MTLANIHFYNVRISHVVKYGLNLANIHFYNVRISHVVKYGLHLANIHFYNVRISHVVKYGLQALAKDLVLLTCPSNVRVAGIMVLFALFRSFNTLFLVAVLIGA